EFLKIFNNGNFRRDIIGIDKLPCAIQTCLLARYNTSNEIGYRTIDRSFNIIPYLRKAWADLCKTYPIEAKWYHKGHKPTLEEYINNAVISTSAPAILQNKEALGYVDKLPSIMRCSSMILRLTNDLGISSVYNLKSIQCYMNETGASEDVARKHIMDMLHETWKTINKHMFDHYSFVEEPFLSGNPNLCRTAQFFYQYGDGHGNPKQ
ncbi:LOW QUALITY PROTEIN: Terpene_synth_C domain-containing protein, partial [Cephalotus follicularis]